MGLFGDIFRDLKIKSISSLKKKTGFNEMRRKRIDAEKKNKNLEGQLDLVLSDVGALNDKYANLASRHEEVRGELENMRARSVRAESVVKRDVPALRGFVKNVKEEIGRLEDAYKEARVAYLRHGNSEIGVSEILGSLTDNQVYRLILEEEVNKNPALSRLPLRVYSSDGEVIYDTKWFEGLKERDGVDVSQQDLFEGVSASVKPDRKSRKFNLGGGNFEAVPYVSPRDGEIYAMGVTYLPKGKLSRIVGSGIKNVLRLGERLDYHGNKFMKGGDYATE